MSRTGLKSLIVALALLAVAPGAWATAHAAGADADGDGVPDSEDWCLDTPPGTRVGPDGCPAGAIGSWRDTAVCEVGPGGAHPAGVDADRDGAPDSEDWCLMAAWSGSPDGCPREAVPVSCEQTGLARPTRHEEVAIVEPVVPPKPEEGDEDGDGVPDSRDKCPHTPRGLKVDRDGCVVLEGLVLKGVTFKTGSATLAADSSATLDSVADSLKRNPTVKVEVGGHTDDRGSPEHNQSLSERRAEAVRQYLVKQGVAGTRLSARGYGQSKPIDDNKTPAGRANNRRVELRITSK